MKNNRFFFCLGVLLFVFGSCKKDSTTVAAAAPPDLSNTSWAGSTTINGIAVNLTFLLNANGTLTGNTVSVGGTFANSGTWSKTPNSNTVYMYYTTVTVPGSYSAQGTLNSTANKIETGTATNSSNAIYTYSYSLVKF